jgi:hypothetical protein
MAGPIRNLLERRPLRNAVRGLLGLQPRYGMSAVETVGATDDMQGSNLNAMPTRRQPAPVDNTPYASNTVAKPPVAPSPEARAVSMARTQDSQNRQEVRRQEEGIATPAPSQPRKPESGGFSMAIPVSETDAPPEHPMLEQAKALYAQAAASRARAEQILQSPMMKNPNNPNYAIFAAQAENFYRRASSEQDRADQFTSQFYGQGHTLQLQEQREKAALDIERIRKGPEESLTRDAMAFRDTVLMSGIGPAAQMATQAYFAAAKSNEPPGTANYQARLLQNQMQAAGVSVGANAQYSLREGKTRYRIDSPALVELASVIKQMAPDDPQQRAVLIAQIVAAAQNQSRLTPTFANSYNTHLRGQVEAQIKRMEGN